MRRLASAALVSTLCAATIAGAILVGDTRESDADLDANSGVFTSRVDRVRLIVPRAWRATDLPGYPGIVLWMTPRNGDVPGQIAVTSETITRELQCSWPTACRRSSDPWANRYYCALKEKLGHQGLRVDVVKDGPRENGSIWFDYDDGKHFLRHAILVSSDHERAVSLVLSAPTNEWRASLGRSFDQVLRTLRVIEAPPPIAGSGSGSARGSAAGSAPQPPTASPTDPETRPPLRCPDETR